MNADDAVRRAFRDVPTARLASLDPDGWPHVAPLWFVWCDDALYISSRMSGSTWRNAERDPRVMLVIDRGRDWSELTGVQIAAEAELFQAEHPDVREAMSAWHEKYRSLYAGDGFERLAEAVPDLGFLRIEPERLRFWDHARNR